MNRVANEWIRNDFFLRTSEQKRNCFFFTGVSLSTICISWTKFSVMLFYRHFRGFICHSRRIYTLNESIRWQHYERGGLLSFHWFNNDKSKYALRKWYRCDDISFFKLFRSFRSERTDFRTSCTEIVYIYFAYSQMHTNVVVKANEIRFAIAIL